MPRPRSDIASRILVAARARFLAEGVDGASLRSIAEDAGTNLGMIYYYFPSKDELFLAVIEQVYGKLLEDLGGALGGEASVEARVRRAYRRVAAMSEAEFDVVRIVVREALVSSERLGRLVERFRRGHVPMVIAAVGEGIARGELAGDKPLPLVLAAIAALGVLPQVARRRLAADVPALAPLLPAPQSLADGLVDVLLHGVAAPRRARVKPRRR
jgi:AcrR family transcriptional regulator